MDSPLSPNAVHYIASGSAPRTSSPQVKIALVGDGFGAALRTLLAAEGLQVIELRANEAIPGSYWGAPEAGLVGDRLFVRADTPLHSALHEACHFICMDAGRRATLDTNAGGDDVEEVAVCYLQVLLADRIDGSSRDRMRSEERRAG